MLILSTPTQAWTLYNDRLTCAGRKGVRRSGEQPSGLWLTGLHFGAGLVSKTQDCFTSLSTSVIISAMGIMKFTNQGHGRD